MNIHDGQMLALLKGAARSRDASTDGANKDMRGDTVFHTLAQIIHL